ncbi:MAG TPA: nucleotidyltransferase family protein [Acidimicrobiia bacterium]|nr:nucleotidyltransferase family protein [Acidimicrobiia bacterium]
MSATALPTLLLDLAAGRPTGEAKVDTRTIKLANEHGLTGLLWTWASKHETDTALKTEMAQNDLYIQAHLVNLWKVLEETVARLQAAGIEVATIKGVTAEARWYGRRGERPCSDVDLLMSPDQLARVSEAVQLLEPDHPWAAQVGPLAVEGRIQTVTTRVDNIEVDLHFDLFKLGIPTRQNSEVWRRTRSFSLPSGNSVQVLDDTTALLHFLVHLNKDRFQRLLGYADIARVLASGNVDWDQAIRLTQGEGITTTTFQSLEVVLNRLSLPWPNELEKPSGLRAQLWNVIWRPGIRLRGAEGRLRFRRRQDWVAFLAKGRAFEALYWWLREMWPPASVVEVRYADIRGPYLWRLTRGRWLTARATRKALADRVPGGDETH